MFEGCGIKVKGGAYGIVLTDDENKWWGGRVGEPKVAICLNCGEVSMYLEDVTRLQSVNDQPTNVDVYGTVSIKTAGEVVVLYYYDKDGKHYIEQPYSGIYELAESIEDRLLWQ